MATPHELRERLEALEMKAAYAEDLLDALNLTIYRQQLQITQLQRELQAHPTRGLTPSKLASILDQAEQGDLLAQFDLYEDMEEKDGHIAAELGKRRRACVLDWNVVPPEGADAAEKKLAAQLGELLMEIPDFEDMVFDLTDAIGNRPVIRAAMAQRGYYECCNCHIFLL